MEIVAERRPLFLGGCVRRITGKKFFASSMNVMCQWRVKRLIEFFERLGICGLFTGRIFTIG
jgi:hypothetical protein